ncbi:MAG: carboxypeptidase-like regulatory domain-containing protein [Planctomycetota bacterium]|jgi:hypothetical protein
MARRLILKGIGVLTLVGMGIVALAVIVALGYFFIALVFPNRMMVIGRVTDTSGRSMKGVEVRAVPLPVYDAYPEEGPWEARDTEHTVMTDENGRYEFKRLIASGGLKEGMWLQEYDIVATAEGYRPQTIRVRNNCDRHKDIIELSDFILEKNQVSAGKSG